MFILPVIVTALGLFLLVKLRFFPLRHPLKTAKGCFCALLDGGRFRNLSLALAGTLGVGNILGVAISISVGGAGSVLWIFVSGLFSAIIKFAEALVSVDEHRAGGGGMMYVIASRQSGGRLLGGLYALLCLILAFVMGGAMQSSAAVSATALVTDVPTPLFISVFMLLFATFIFGRRERIKSITSVLIPLATIAYLAVSLTVIFRYFSELPRVIRDIFSSAFAPRSAVGGVLGYLAASPIVRGYSTGILSNEAGAGTSSMAHASGQDRDPLRAGLSGLFEVLFDTAFLCTITALAILLPNPEVSGMSGAELITSSLSLAFYGADILLALSVTAFALATVVCWYYYGGVCCRYLFGERSMAFFLPAYAVAVLVGALTDCSVLASLSDILLLALMLLTTPVIIKSSDRIRALSECGGLL